MYYAKVVDGTITETLVIGDTNFFDEFIDTSPGDWILGSKDGSVRANGIAKGFTYDKTNDVFIQPQPFNSWVLNGTTYKWEAPVTRPDDGKNYTWNEATTNWVEVT